MELWCHLAVGVAAYLAGSIPTGYLVARARGVDIRSAGSGNIGATNAFRVLGRTAGVFVLSADFLKGLLACLLLTPLIYRLMERSSPAGATPESFTVVAGVCAVLGHNFTCWLRFKGGKGIATSAGVLTAMVPLPLVIILSVWLLVFAIGRYVSLASVAASLALPPAVFFTGGSTTLLAVCSALTILAVYRHRANLRRLVEGTEPRVGMRPPQP